MKRGYFYIGNKIHGGNKIGLDNIELVSVSKRIVHLEDGKILG